jgi:hypothetical protein
MRNAYRLRALNSRYFLNLLMWMVTKPVAVWMVVVVIPTSINKLFTTDDSSLINNLTKSGY